MIEAAIRIIDRIIQLKTIREKNAEKYFNNSINPLYEDAEVVVKDYLKLFS